MLAHEALEPANIFSRGIVDKQGRGGRSTTTLKRLTDGDVEGPALVPAEKGSTASKLPPLRNRHGLIRNAFRSRRGIDAAVGWMLPCAVVA